MEKNLKCLKLHEHKNKYGHGSYKPFVVQFAFIQNALLKKVSPIYYTDI